MCRMLFI